MERFRVEASDVFYSPQKLERLLCDVHFVLRTDHKNLTYVNFDSSARITRWKLVTQEFDFSIKYVAGRENVIADAFSRLVEVPRDQEVAVLLAHSSTVPNLPPDVYRRTARFLDTSTGHFSVAATTGKHQEASHT